MARLLRVAAFAILALPALAQADPVRVSRVNPHYFERNGTPFVLVTSDHHYGAIIDRDFDQVRFLDTLAASGMNLTRIYPGGMFEPPDKYAPGNPLGPLSGRQLLPWARSDVPGADPTLALPGQPSTKYDLSRWNPEYFARLKAFVTEADRRGIVVEVAFFNGMYADGWPRMAFYHANNVQGVGTYEAADCGLFTTSDPRNADVVPWQQAYVAKVTTELNAFDNVIFDISDEPSLQGKPDGSIVLLDDAKVIPWLHALRDTFLATEAGLPKKHVLGQTVQNLSPDLSAEDWCQWLPTEYVKPARRALEKDYATRKPIVDVESDYFGARLVKHPYEADAVRLEAWWFILGGGAGVINLNSEYHRGQEAGGTDTRDRILPARKALRAFMERLDLSTIARFEGVSAVPAGAMAVALATPGREYAVYLFHGNDEPEWGAHLAAVPGQYRDGFRLAAVPVGAYSAEWVDPQTGRTLATETIHAAGGNLDMKTPAYTLDVALRLARAK